MDGDESKFEETPSNEHGESDTDYDDESEDAADPATTYAQHATQVLSIHEPLTIAVFRRRCATQINNKYHHYGFHPTPLQPTSPSEWG